MTQAIQQLNLSMCCKREAGKGGEKGEGRGGGVEEWRGEERTAGL